MSKIIGNTKPPQEIDRTLVDKLNAEAKRKALETSMQDIEERTLADDDDRELIELEGLSELSGVAKNYREWKEFYKDVAVRRRMASLADLYKGVATLNRLHQEGNATLRSYCEEFRDDLRADLGKTMLFDTVVDYKAHLDMDVIHNPETMYRISYRVNIPAGFGGDIKALLESSEGVNTVRALFYTQDTREMIADNLDFLLEGRELHLSVRPTKKRYLVMGEEIRKEGTAVARTFDGLLIEDSRGIRTTKSIIALSLDEYPDEWTDAPGIARGYKE